MRGAHGANRCAVRAVRAWLEVADIHRGAVFRRMRRGDTVTEDRLSDQSVALIVKRHAQATGLPPTLLSVPTRYPRFGGGKTLVPPVARVGPQRTCSEGGRARVAGASDARA
jgi:hypothetical protein